ncbi:immunity 52 family protein [Stenotrophomonas maltophilia]|nr:immunity 52 family protein [Stenotrophomonas maltophilia]
MICTILRIDIGQRKETDFLGAYWHLLEMLRRIPGNHNWFCGENTPKQKLVPFEDEGAVVARLRERAELMGSEAFAAAVVNDSGTKRHPGLIEIDYMPEFGYMTLAISRPDKLEANPTSLVVGIMLAVLEGEPEVTFAFADVYDKVHGEFQYYKTSYATFPHRKCVGWMAYVRNKLSDQDLPIADAVVPAPNGSIVISVNEAFDLANPDHIQRANEVEMEMNDMGLLEVTDATF